jgi:hypothetical protein
MNQSMTKLYPQDGTGRDSYIFFDNGGFYPGNTKLQQKPNLSKCKLPIHPRGLWYLLTSKDKLQTRKKIILFLRWNWKRHLCD